jgi:HPt (histidine-containing phosphotransfer) domain-containing protein
VTDVLDRRVLDDLRASVGNDEAFFAELVDELLADAPGQLDSLRSAAATGDAEGARRAAHTLKGNGRTFGATRLAMFCQEAEAAGANGDLEAVRARLGDIETAWREAESALVATRDGTY